MNTLTQQTFVYLNIQQAHLRWNLLVMMQPLQFKTSCPRSWLTVPSPHLHCTQTQNRAHFCLWRQRDHIQTTPLKPPEWLCGLWVIECDEFSLRRQFLDPDRSQNNCCAPYQSIKATMWALRRLACLHIRARPFWGHASELLKVDKITTKLPCFSLVRTDHEDSWLILHQTDLRPIKCSMGSVGSS